ncbi:MAG TPA: hypothetical protein VFT17_12700 [Propionibacteriaceae bacterium]|nr:hypothetical protein [Propionibacteriaceae bacterium]
MRANVRVCLGYLDAWLAGNGAVAIDHLMEDAATVEICVIPDLAVAALRHPAVRRSPHHTGSGSGSP